MDEKEHLQNKINAMSIVEEIFTIKREILAKQIVTEFNVSTWKRLKNLDIRLQAFDTTIREIKHAHIAMKFDMRLMEVADQRFHGKEKQ